MRTRNAIVSQPHSLARVSRPRSVRNIFLKTILDIARIKAYPAHSENDFQLQNRTVGRKNENVH